jgi:hypothetical protein
MNIIDDRSRVAVASRAHRAESLEAALDVFTSGADTWGLPSKLLADNAKAFEHLTPLIAALGVGRVHSRPYHPQTCGKVERFHQTLKKWLRRQSAVTDLVELQAQLDGFVEIYNHQRPHRSIGRCLPAQCWTDAPKSGPASHALTIDGPVTTDVYNHTVSAGIVAVGGYQISVGAAHNTKQATVIITGTQCHVFIDSRLARHFTINPTKVVQPIHNRRGRPSKPRP